MLRIHVDRNAELPIRDQLVHAFRTAISSGELSGGQALPPSRKLAVQIGVSRATLLDAFDQLIAEGYLQTIASSRTLVSHECPGSVEQAVPNTVPLTAFGEDCSVTHAVAIQQPKVKSSRLIDFSPSATHVDDMLIEEWSRAVWRRTRAAIASDLNFAEDRAGSRNLRAAIAQKILPERGINVDAKQVIITLGFMQAFDLLIRIHVGANDHVIAEDPCFGELREVFAFHHLQTTYIPIDREGMQVKLLPDTSDRFSLAVVTPSYHFPSGTVLALPRRLELLQWAAQSSCILVEDDYSSEFVFAEHRIPALKCLDRNDNVAYISTFTKGLFPSLGIGFLIAPATLSNAYANARRISSDPLPTHLQEALADFIWDGSYHRHLRRMQQIYSEKRKAIMHELRTALRTKIRFKSALSGTHIVVTMRTDAPSSRILEQAARAEVSIYSTQAWYTDNRDRREFIFGFGALSNEQIVDGVERLRNALQSLL